MGTKRLRSAPKSRRPYKMARAITYKPAQRFVPRSLGNAMAVTERKYWDAEAHINIATVGASWIGTIADPPTKNTIFSPSEGNDIDGRIGRKVQIKKIQVRGALSAPAKNALTAPEDGVIVRILLVQDTQTNGTLMDPSNLLKSGAMASLLTNIFAFQNTESFGRYRVLKDKFYPIQRLNSVQDVAGQDASGVIRKFSFSYKPRKPIIVHYNNTNGGTVADITDHSFHIIAGFDDPDMNVTLDYKSRVVYVDP